MRHLFGTLLILILLVMPSCKYFKGGIFGKKSKTLAEVLARQDSIQAADSIRRAEELLLAIEAAKLDSARRAEADHLSQASKYNIIVGSFVTPEFAAGLSDHYKKQGYDTKILKLEGTRFELVSAESHENFRKAVSRLREFQDTVELNAWMYIRK
jgi:hypothetical protein